ncbi:hypothetical protein SGZLLDDJ_CDS_0015 [Mycoplasmopsis phage vB_Mfe_PMF329]|nr:hypothetical protein SGZLLDDJ_CDS_0015 [Mycoplasmopsis phage vB_Mfe_PMF329]
MAHVKKNPKYKWLETFYQYISGKEQLTLTKSSIDKTLGSIQLYNSNIEDFKMKDLNFYNVNSEKVIYQYLTDIRGIKNINISQYRNLIEHFNQTNVLVKRFIHKYRAINFYKFRESNSSNYVYYIESILYPFNNDKRQINYYFKDTVTNKQWPEFLKVKELKSEYIFCYVKDNGVYKFVKFNNLFDENITNTFRVTFTFTPLNDWNNNYKYLDFSESYTDNSIIDVIVWTQENSLWYGFFNSDVVKSNKSKWEKHGTIYTGKWTGTYDKETGSIQTKSSPFKVNELRDLTISTMTKFLNEKKEFYGNILVNTAAETVEDLNTPTTYNFNLPLVYKSTTLSSINTNTPNALQVNKENTNIIPLTELSNSILQAKQNLGFDPLGEDISDDGDSLGSFSFSTLDYWINYSGRSGGSFLTRVSDRAYSNYDTNIKLNKNQIDKIINNPNNLYIELSYDTIKDITKQFFILKNSDGEIAKIEWERSPHKRPPFISDFIAYDVSEYHNKVKFSIQFNRKYVHPQKDRQTGTVYKLSIRSDEENPNGLIFEKDKELKNVIDTQDSLVVSNNEIYLPVKQDNLWKLYLFNNSIQLNENNLIVPSSPTFLYDYPIHTQEIKLLSVKEKKTSTPNLISVVNNKEVLIFINSPYKKYFHTGEYEEVSIGYDDTIEQEIVIELPYGGVSKHTLPDGYVFDRDFLTCFKEQFVFRCLFVNEEKNKYDFYNIKWDGKHHNFSNQPYLFANESRWNTITENFNITHTTTNNLLGSARISDVLVDNNTVSFSNSIANYSLNLGDDFDNVNQINYYDNNGNIAFSTNTLFNKSQYDNLIQNLHVSFNWYEDNTPNPLLANQFARLFTDISEIEKFKITHIKFLYNGNSPSGKPVEVIEEIPETNFTIDGNDLIIWVPLVNETREYVQTYSNLSLGNKETNTWWTPEFKPWIIPPGSPYVYYLAKFIIRMVDNE